jgi:hypothetical protein
MDVDVSSDVALADIAGVDEVAIVPLVLSGVRAAVVVVGLVGNDGVGVHDRITHSHTAGRFIEQFC